MVSQKTADRNRCAGLTFSLAGVLALALALRLWGIGFGFPYAYHFDEPAYVRIALDLGAGIIGRQPNPTGFPNILFGEYVVYFIAGRLGGFFASAAEIEQFWRMDPSATLILLGRLTSVFLGTLNVLAMYKIGEKTSGQVAGRLAALFLAVAFLHVRDSHYAVPDIAAASLTSLMVLFSILTIRRRSRRYLGLAGATAGYAIATKWSVWSVVVPLFVAALYKSGDADRQTGHPLAGRWLLTVGHVSLVSGSFIGGFLAGGFQLVLEPVLYFKYALYEWEAGKAGGFWFWRVDTVPGWLFHLKTLNYGLGTVLLGLALAGLARRLAMSVRGRDRMSILLLSFPVLYFLSMSSTRHYFARYALPLVPFCALFGAEAVVAASAWAGTRETKWKWGLAVLLALAAIAQPLSSSIRHDMILAHQDTRTLAKQWIEAHIPAGAKIAVDWPVYGPPLAGEIYSLKTLSGVGLARHPIEWYRERGFNYLIASSFVYDIPLLDHDLDDTRRAFYAALDERLELVQEFNPGKGDIEPSFIFDEVYGPAISLWQRERPGPVIKIYRLQ
jgi:hypothetical protein